MRFDGGYKARNTWIGCKAPRSLVRAPHLANIFRSLALLRSSSLNPMAALDKRSRSDVN